MLNDCLFHRHPCKSESSNSNNSLCGISQSMSRQGVYVLYQYVLSFKSALILAPIFGLPRAPMADRPEPNARKSHLGLSVQSLLRFTSLCDASGCHSHISQSLAMVHRLAQCHACEIARFPSCLCSKLSWVLDAAKYCGSGKYCAHGI